MPPKSQKDEALTALANRIFSVMLDDILMDVALQSHHETVRSRSICTVCKTRCSSVHTPSNNPTVSSSQSTLPSRPSTPANGGTSTPTSTKPDGNLYLECVQCSRQIASNRYAPHLSSCMGLSTTRRGAARGSATKSKPSSEAGGRSTSPEGNDSDDGKGKGKSKTKRADGSELNLKRKRLASPQLTPNKKQKKPSASGSPLSRVKASSADVPTLPSNGQGHHSPSKVPPSKLRDSSTASLQVVVERSLTPSSSRFSSPGPDPDSPGSSSPYTYSSQQSPTLPDRGGSLKGRAAAPDVVVVGPPRASPPRVVVDDYLLDDGGDETGSSTDTDSS